MTGQIPTHAVLSIYAVIWWYLHYNKYDLNWFPPSTTNDRPFRTPYCSSYTTINDHQHVVTLWTITIAGLRIIWQLLDINVSVECQYFTVNGRICYGWSISGCLVKMQLLRHHQNITASWSLTCISSINGNAITNKIAHFSQPWLVPNLPYNDASMTDTQPTIQWYIHNWYPTCHTMMQSSWCICHWYPIFHTMMHPWLVPNLPYNDASVVDTQPAIQWYNHHDASVVDTQPAIQWYNHHGASVVDT